MKYNPVNSGGKPPQKNKAPPRRLEKSTDRSRCKVLLVKLGHDEKHEFFLLVQRLFFGREMSREMMNKSPSLKLTAGTSKLMVGIRLFPFGMANF